MSGKIKMCEFCRNDGKEHTIFESDENRWYTTFLSNGKFYIFHRRKGFLGADGIDVENCPMCGRKIGEIDMREQIEELKRKLTELEVRLAEKEKDYKTVSGLLNQCQMENGGLKERIAELEAINDNLENILEQKAGYWKDHGFSFLDIVDMQDRIAELETEIQQRDKRITEVYDELKMKDGTKMFQILLENTSGEAKELLARHMYENLECVICGHKSCYERIKELEEQLQNPAETEDVICSMSPIQVAEYLIGHETHIDETTVFGIKYPEDDVRTFEIPDLEQIAEHLLVYCRHNKENEE